MTDRRTFIAGAAALAAPRLAWSQTGPDLPRVGMLFAAAPSAVAARIAAFREGLASLGYVDGKQVALEIRYAHGDLARMPVLASELVRLPVKVIVTGGSGATRPALAATKTIPIVMGQDNDPVGAGIVASLARPGGNVTGLSTVVPELCAKQMTLLAELVPGITRVAIIGDSAEAGGAESLAEALRAAAQLGIVATFLDLRSVGPPARLFPAAVQSRAAGVLVLASAYLFAHQDEIVALALRSRLPAFYVHPEFVRQGGLATYGVNVPELFRRAAGYVVKILNGANPADMPVEQPTKFELVFNLQTAKALGIAIPQSMLLRADEVIQ